MTNTRLAIGSLSSDLFRVAALKVRGADEGAERFLRASRKWSIEVASDEGVADYVREIGRALCEDNGDLDLKKAEKYLMYAVLLQNYVLKRVTVGM